MRWYARTALAVGLVLAGVVLLVSRGDAPPEPAPGEDRAAETSDPVPDEWEVAPWGSDDASGAPGDPLRTLQHALGQLGAGDTLVVRGGRYEERVVLTGDEISPGSVQAPIVVAPARGEQPVIEGLLWLEDADHWTIRGIDVTWSAGNDDDEHMVKLTGGTGWRLTDAEIWGARSFAAVLVTGGATDFRLDHLYVHDTHATNDVNQDHLIYLSEGNIGGIVERNILARSPNGRGLKVGPGSPEAEGTDDVVIRFNTFVDNTGPSNIRFSGNSSRNLVHNNLMVASGDGEAAVTAFDLSGVDNVVRDNAAWEAEGVVDVEGGLLDGGGNIMVDPVFAPGGGDYRPSNVEAARYGALARL